jgi:type I restriction enzyme R subunit
MSKPSNFEFLENEYPILYQIGVLAEHNLHQDPATSLWKMRVFGEKMTEILFKEHALEFPTENTFVNRLRELCDERILPSAIKDLFHFVRIRGNKASHDHSGTFSDARQALVSGFKLSVWLYETYSNENADIRHLAFEEPTHHNNNTQLNLLEQDYKALEEKYAELLKERATDGISQEKQKDIEERSAKSVRKIDWSEQETRELIDEQLRNAGWEADTKSLNYKTYKTLPEKGRNLAIAEWPVTQGWADYALFVGEELYGIVEAKKYKQDISTDLGQSKRYAAGISESDGISLLGEWDTYKAPFLFSTNGRPYLEQIKTKSGIWFLDVRRNTNLPKPLQGWYSPEGLIKLRQQDIDEANQKLAASPLDFLQSKAGLGLRDYQIKAIEAVENKIIRNPNDRRALVAMATGTGKTRMVIGLCYHLIQTNRFNRILFLVDRTILGTQAADAFKDNKIEQLNTFADIYEITGLRNAIPGVDARLHFATVQSMVKRLFYSDENTPAPTVDQYDCIVIDEAHRGYLLDRELEESDLDFRDQMDYVSKYRKVLEYFDAYIIGLTATPALHTTDIFGKPVYTYSYREAVIDGFLIDHDPPKIIRTKLSEEGIRWKAGEKPTAYDDESNTIVELHELEDELQFDVSGFNKQVITESFNRTVVKQLVQELDPDGEEKTLIFAATDKHADALVNYLREEFQAIGVSFPERAIQKITGSIDDPQSMVRQFKNEKYPVIAVTVDLLTTGVDVPSICHIVFLRRVKSRILYEQMLGRATRRCDEIGKEAFQIYDAVGLYETLEDYTQMKPVVVSPTTSFRQLVDELDQIADEDRAKLQVEQIIAKLQRKKLQIASGSGLESFMYYTKDKNADELLTLLKEGSLQETVLQIRELNSLWKFLDETNFSRRPLYFSEHEDRLLGVDTGYGAAKKPEDYLTSFTHFIQTKQNEITALKVVLTRPAELDRRSLRELSIALAQEGYDTRKVKTAWKQARNQDIGADIISFIRTLALGSSLQSREERVRKAVDKVRAMRPWNKVQQKWLDRFEKQLINETVLQVEDLDNSPFTDAGGFKQLNKTFDDRLEEVIKTINENLYQETA